MCFCGLERKNSRLQCESDKGGECELKVPIGAVASSVKGQEEERAPHETQPSRVNTCVTS